MGFWVGVDKGFDRIERNVLESKKIALEEERLSMAKKDRLFNFLKGIKGGVGSATKSKLASSTELNLKKLLKIGADPELVARVGGYDPSSIDAITKDLMNQYEKRRIGASPITPQEVDYYLSNLVTATVPGKEPDFEKLKKIGISEKDLETVMYEGVTLKDLLTQQLTTKDATFAEGLPSRVDIIDSSDYAAIVKRADDYLIDKLRNKEASLLAEKERLMEEQSNAPRSKKPNYTTQLENLARELQKYNNAMSSYETLKAKGPALELVGGDLIYGLVQERPEMLFGYDWGAYAPYVEKLIFNSVEDIQKAIDNLSLREGDYYYYDGMIRQVEYK